MVPSLVIDNSVVMAWCFMDERTEYARGVRIFLDDNTAIQPVVWPLEAANVVSVAVRRGRITPEDGFGYLSLLEELPLEVEDGIPARVFREVYALAQKHQLSTYDASYLDLAMRRKIPLATQDKALIRAATACGVALFEP